jgi:hypothetical protein
MKIILFVLLFAVVLMSGCTDKNELAGNTYTGPDGEIIRFFDDGKVHCTKSTGAGALGVYTIEDNRVYLNGVFVAWDADITDNGTRLIDRDGDAFVLNEQP